MTLVLTAAILGGALWVCCALLVPRQKAADTRATGEASLVQILEPPRSSVDERVARSVGRVTHPALLYGDTNDRENSAPDTSVHDNNPLDTIVNDNTLLDANAHDNTRLDIIVNHNTPFDTDVNDNTLFDTSVHDSTPLGGNVNDNTPLDTSVIDNTPLDTSVIDNTPLDTIGNDITPLHTIFNDNTPLDTSLKENTPLDTNIQNDTSLDINVNDNTPINTSTTTSPDADVHGNAPLDSSPDADVHGNAPLDTSPDADVHGNAPLDTSPDADVHGNAPLKTSTTISPDANIHGNAPLKTSTTTSPDADVHGNASLDTSPDADVHGNAPLDTSPDADVHGNAPLDTSPDADVHGNAPLNTSTTTSPDADVHGNAPLDTSPHADVHGNASVELAPHRRGLRTWVEGDRLVLAVSAEYLTDCAGNLSASSEPPRPAYLNLNSTRFLRGRLKVEFRFQDHATVGEEDLTTKRCMIGIMLGWEDLIYWINLSRFDVSRGKNFQVTFVDNQAMGYGYGVQRRTFNTSLERAVMFPFYSYDLVLEVEWLRLPSAFSMDMRYRNFEHLTFWDMWRHNDVRTFSRYSPMDNLKLTHVVVDEGTFSVYYFPLNRRGVFTTVSHPKGFVRTAFWDGVTIYPADIASTVSVYWAHVFHVRAPDGQHTMMSWEHVGLGVPPDCDTFMVFVVEHEEDTAGLPTHFACTAAPPPPFLLDWPIAYVRVKAPARHDRYTGFSIRYSFHNASALPQQLADKTWNCSVAHWVDFKQHLQCNLLVECAGAEDEADCPYYARRGGTCRHGYLAAGGSCFTFGPAPEALTSWVQAEAACRSRGARLPTLNTPAKWRAVLDLVSHRGWDSIYIGLSSGDSSLPDLYSDFLQWSDSSFAYYIKAVYLSDAQCTTCAFLKNNRRPDFVYLDSCYKKVSGNLLCEVQGPSDLGAIVFPTGNTPRSRNDSTRCPKGHVTHNFLSCDPRSDCLPSCYTQISAALTSLPPAFKCRNGFERVPFTLVCDHREDCSDASDEICVFPPCQEFECDNKQCVAPHKTCDTVKDCLDGSDETACAQAFGRLSIVNFSKPLPAMVLHDGKGFFDLLDIADRSAQSTSSDTRSTVEGCPDSHFQCPGVSYYCLPVYVRCNGVRDCPGHQDEVDCDNFQCPGFYRCRRSKICLHDDYVCDGIFQCPQRDDELMCGFVCPVGCTCYGLAFYCTIPFDASRHTGLRFLDASESGMTLTGVLTNTMLFHLSLAKCNITQLETMDFVNVFHLDLRENSITTLTEKHIAACQNLQVFVLAGNPLRRILEDSSSGQGASFAKLHTLDLSAVPITAAQMMNLYMFPNVINLNLSNTRLDAMSGLSVFSKLRVLDLRGCPVTFFTRSLFQGLDDLSTVYADNYKLCCPETLPDGFNVLNCHAPVDEVSSCEGLLKSGLYRVVLSVLSVVNLVGNAGSFACRVLYNRPKQQSSSSIFVTNLCVSDFLMGMYSSIIAVADRLYLGNYLWNDITWRGSVTCKMAGVMSLLSSEVSIIIICLITVDRFLVTRFPFSRQLHFSLRTARVSCVTAWSVGVLLVVTPLLPMTSHWQLYSQTGMCIPLPVTRVQFAGKQYSFGILIILNFVLFLVIASGQMSIYLTIRANSMTTSDTTQKAKDLTIARRFVSVAVSNFLCWFPFGLLGMLSSRGHPVPVEASVVIAVFVLPLNSALNPFLYAVSVILERRQRARETRLQRILLARHGVASAQREGERSK